MFTKYIHIKQKKNLLYKLYSKENIVTELITTLTSTQVVTKVKRPFSRTITKECIIIHECRHSNAQRERSETR